MKSMKWLVLMLAFCMAVPAAMGAALLSKGANELAIGGDLDFQSGEGTEFQLDLRYAYFVIDRLSIGPRFTVSDTEFDNYYSIGLASVYNFQLPENLKPLIGTDLVPYLGVMVDYRHASFDGLGDESAGVLGGEVGLKFFLTDSAAVTVGMVGEVASEDIFVDDTELTNLNLGLQLGMRFYF